MEEIDWVEGEVTLSVAGIPLRLKLTVPSNPVKPQVMLPLFRQMANAFTDMGTDLIEKEHKHVSCKKGCGACCRQPVPLAELEVYHIAAMVDSLPEPRRTEIRTRFKNAVTHFQNMGWFARLEECEEEDALKDVVFTYFLQGVPCPFLEDEACSIHDDRPIACREYLVTSPKENCSSKDRATVNQVPLPINASDGVRHVGRTDKLSNRNFVPFIRALEWAELFPENFNKKTGEEWLAEFFSA